MRKYLENDRTGDARIHSLLEWYCLQWPLLRYPQWQNCHLMRCVNKCHRSLWLRPLLLLLPFEPPCSSRPYFYFIGQGSSFFKLFFEEFLNVIAQNRRLELGVGWETHLE